MAHGAWLIESPAAPQPPLRQFEMETRAFERAAADGTSLAFVWEPDSRILVTTRSEVRLPRFETATAKLTQEGWPVYVRPSGGTAVPLVPGMLVLTLVYRDSARRDHRLDHAYEVLCRPLLDALLRLGVDASQGEVEGCFCDGRYNLVVAGRKLAGTAQRQRPGAAGYTVMSHAVLLVAASARDDAAIINRFYELSGSERRIVPATATTLEELTRLRPAARLLERLRSLVVEALEAVQ